jgi:hypothetical protein
MVTSILEIGWMESVQGMDYICSLMAIGTAFFQELSVGSFKRGGIQPPQQFKGGGGQRIFTKYMAWGRVGWGPGGGISS